MEQITRSEDEWRQELTADQYRVLRGKGTEAPGTGEYEHCALPGTYACAACGNELFDSDAKYDSGSGWPSFFAPESSDRVRLEIDEMHGMVRTEVVCGACDSHLGHVFDDGPPPTGLRYCINSVSLKLKQAG